MLISQYAPRLEPKLVDHEIRDVGHSLFVATEDQDQ